MTSLIKPARGTYLSTHERHKSWNRTPHNALKRVNERLENPTNSGLPGDVLSLRLSLTAGNTVLLSKWGETT